MTRYMVDSVNVDKIPQAFARGLIGCYVDGRYANFSAMRAKFPNARLVTITTNPNTSPHLGIVIDKENGDYTDQQCIDSVIAKRKIGLDPAVYCSYTGWSRLESEFFNAGIPQPYYWIAFWDNQPFLLSGAVAKQYSNGNNNTAPGCDLSVVSDYWPGVDDPINPIVEDEMNFIYQVQDGPSAGTEIYNFGSGPTHIDGATSLNLTAKGVQVCPISDAVYRTIPNIAGRV